VKSARLLTALALAVIISACSGSGTSDTSDVDATVSSNAPSSTVSNSVDSATAKTTLIPPSTNAVAPTTTAPISPATNSGSSQNSTTTTQITPTKRITDDVLQTMYQEVDAILVRYGRGKLTLQQYASKIAKLRDKWTVYGMNISTKYDDDQLYHILTSRKATYCIKVIWQDGTRRGIPAECP